MADIKLNEFGAVTSIAKLLGLDSSGNGKYITSENFLANTFKDRGSIPNGMDLNTYSYGMYYSCLLYTSDAADE